MNLDEEKKQSRYKIHYEKNKDYYKKYYQDRKENWNNYTPTECECGCVVKSMYRHKKTKKHEDFIRKLNSVN